MNCHLFKLKRVELFRLMNSLKLKITKELYTVQNFIYRENRNHISKIYLGTPLKNQINQEITKEIFRARILNQNL